MTARIVAVRVKGTGTSKNAIKEMLMRILTLSVRSNKGVKSIVVKIRNYYEARMKAHRAVKGNLDIAINFCSLEVVVTMRAAQWPHPTKTP